MGRVSTTNTHIMIGLLMFLTKERSLSESFPDEQQEEKPNVSF